MTVNLSFTQYRGAQPLDLTGITLAFIANQFLDKTITPPVYIQWAKHTDEVNGKTILQVPAGLTATLTPGDYYFNITGQDVAGNVLTYMAGTWPITPVPGLFSGAP